MSRELLAGLRDTFQEIDVRLPARRAHWFEFRVLQLAILKLWIDAGNYADAYRKSIDVPVSTNPWSELVAYRGMLAHALPNELNLDRVYAESSDVARILTEVDNAST